MTTRSDATAPSGLHQTAYTTPNDREIVVARTFDAPRSLVWAAFTDPKHLPNWHTGPAGFTMPVCEIDFRVGGKWRYVMIGPDGNDVTFYGEYREIAAPERIVSTRSMRRFPTRKRS